MYLDSVHLRVFPPLNGQKFRFEKALVTIPRVSRIDVCLGGVSRELAERILRDEESLRRGDAGWSFGLGWSLPGGDTVPYSVTKRLLHVSCAEPRVVNAMVRQEAIVDFRVVHAYGLRVLYQLQKHYGE